MIPRHLTLFLMMTGCSLGWGADNREALAQSRAEYRQAVTDHGANSAQAREARTRLRAARREYHSGKREKIHHAKTQPH